VNLYLLESYLPDISFDKDATIVALTPEACYALDKQAIEYFIIEDYCQPVMSLPSEYANIQSQWIDKFDSILADNVEDIRKYNLRLANFYNVYFQHRVLDQLFAKCYAVNKMLEALQPSEVVLSTYHSDSVSLDFTFHSVGQSYYSQIIPSICNRRNIPLQQFRAESPTRLSPSQARLTRLSRNNSLQRLRFIAKYLANQTTHKSSKGLNIFLPKNTHIGLDFIIDAIKHGHRVYGLSSTCQSIVKYSPLGAAKYCPLNIGYSKDTSWEKIANTLETNSLIYWFNEQFHADVSRMMLDRLKYFVLAICPSILAFYKAISQFYKEAQIDTVIMAHDAMPHESAALLAANHLGLNTVCVSHGDGVYSYRHWEHREAQNYKVVITSNAERTNYYQRLGIVLKHPLQAHTSSHRLQPQLNLEKCRRKHKVGSKVLYLAFFMAGDNRGIEDGAYSDTWLYIFQKSLVQYFATRTDYSFIFEALPATDLLYNPMPDFINDNKFSNISYSTKPFIDHLHSIDRVICDCPSTGLYESVAAGVPVMSLYHTGWNYRQTALDSFGHLLKPFTNTTEAIDHIDAFLNDNPNKYVIKLDTSNDSILDILEHKCP